jgi:hypothetical protein
LGPLFPEGYIIKETIVCDLFGGDANLYERDIGSDESGSIERNL